MSGDAAEGTSAFKAEGSTITNKKGDVFFINNTTTEIELKGNKITNEDKDGVFLKAAAAGWGNEGSNGGQVKLTATSQEIEGDMTVDKDSMLDLYLKDGSSLTGAINSKKQTGDVYVEIEEGSTWTLTADSHVSSLEVAKGSAINLNGHKLYVDGKEYKEGSASKGTAFEFETNSDGGGAQGGQPPQAPPGGDPPDGQPPEGSPGGNPPSGQPPEKQ